MYRIQLKIGEHLIKITSESKAVMTMFRCNFYSLNYFDFTPDIAITIKNEYGSPFVDYDVTITKEENQISFARADYLINVDQDYKNATISIHNDLALKHALMNLYSSYIVHHNWGILLHSSCVLEEGKAHIFSGHSGAGKSTAAQLSYPRQLLSDEATILKITPEKIIVFDSPFRSELEGMRLDKSFKLGSIHILHQSLQNERTGLSKATALLNLIDKVFYWGHSPEETRRILSLLKTLVEKTPVYDLRFQKNNTFWEMIS